MKKEHHSIYTVHVYIKMNTEFKPVSSALTNNTKRERERERERRRQVNRYERKATNTN